MKVHLDIAQTIKYLLYVAGGVILFFAIRGSGCRNNPHIDTSSVIDSLVTAGYVKPGHSPGVKPESISGVPGIEPVAHGSGQVVVQEGHSWPDTLGFEFSIVTGPDGQPWIGAWIEGQPVQWIQHPQIDWPGSDLKDSNWVGFVEATIIDGEFDSGLGIAWTPIHFRGVNIGLCGTVDFDVITEFNPRWASLGIYGDRKFGILRIGGNVGYGFGLGGGPRAGLSIGLGLDL